MRSSATLPDRLNIARRDARYDSALYKILYGGHLVDGVSFSQHARILEVLSEPKGYSADKFKPILLVHHHVTSATSMVK